MPLGVNIATNLRSYLTQAAAGFLQKLAPKEKEAGKGSVLSRPDKAESSDIGDSAALQTPRFAAAIPAAEPETPPQNGAPDFQKVLQTWVQEDPKTLAGLQSFLEVEFAHHSEDPQTFQMVQLVRMLRQAKELLEQQNLRKAASENPEVSDSTVAAERALFGASLMGYAHHLLRRKNLNGRPAAGFDPASSSVDFELSGGSVCEILGEVAGLLRKAEAGLQKALSAGADDRRLRLLIHKMLDICADILQMQRELAIPKPDLKNAELS